MANMYAAPHVWNLVAKQIRTHFPIDEDSELSRVERNILQELSLAFAHRFTDDTGFDPLRFLDMCSPDAERWPFSELWES